MSNIKKKLFFPPEETEYRPHWPHLFHHRATINKKLTQAVRRTKAWFDSKPIPRFSGYNPISPTWPIELEREKPYCVECSDFLIKIGEKLYLCLSCQTHALLVEGEIRIKEFSTGQEDGDMV